MTLIQIGNSRDDKNKLEKTFNIRANVECEIFSPCDVVRPILKMSTESILNSDNYIYIPDFNRYYFKSNTTKSGEITTLSLICDVLMSFKEDIKNCPLIAERSSNIFNSYLKDNDRNFLSYPLNTFKDLGYFSGERLFLLGVG